MGTTGKEARNIKYFFIAFPGTYEVVEISLIAVRLSVIREKG